MEDDVIIQLTTLDGVGKAKAKILSEAGYKTISSLKKANLDEIAGIEGIGEKLAKKIKKSADDAVVVEEIEAEKPAEMIAAAQINPTLDDETKRLLGVRKTQKSKKPQFKQTDSHKKKKLADYWRRPDGIHNKTRYAVKGKTPLVEAGYGSPALVRGLHPSGFEEVIIKNPKDLEKLNSAKQAARIGRTVGARKRGLIETKAAELGLKVLNPTRREVK